MNTFLKLLIFFVILILGFAGLAFYWTFYKPLPDYEETISLTGLSEEVQVHWDAYGVPHIYADNEDDLYYALGYVHAQDRLWQMTLTQIAAEGRFAEFFGENEELIELDKYQRTLGFWKIAQQLVDTLGQEEREVLNAYTHGVNAFVNNNTNRLPVEFSLTGIQPLRWTPARSLAVSRLMGWELNMGWWSEVTYGYLREKLPANQFEQLQLRFPESAPTSLDDEESMGYSAALMPMLQQEIKKRELLEMEGTHVGSNAWLIDGSKSETGYPMLAGDPHLGLDMPGKWYEVHLNLNGKNVSGATLAGVPAVIIGQNDQIAWSFTSIMSDDTDFFLEQTDPLDRGRYVADSLNDTTASYRSFDKIREIIKVKDGDDRSFEIRYTKHGPVISDIYPVQELTEDKVISMQWTGYEMSNEMRTLYQINWAEDFQDFKDALPSFGVPGLNLMYADVEGNIAMYSVAKLPIRSGDPITLREGWDPAQDWQGFIPHDQMPRLINPEDGWIANANNKITTDSYPYYIAFFWEPPSRIERIEQVLTADSTLGYNQFQSLQNDSYSAFAAKLTPKILEIIKNQDAYNFDLPISYLENWNYKYDLKSTAASIFDVFFVNFTENTLKDDFGDVAYSNFIHHENIPVRTMSSLIDTESSFFDDLTTESVETKEDMVVKSMQDAILFLSDSLGSEPFEWRWEQLHTLMLEPPLLSRAAEDPESPNALKHIVDNVLSKGPYKVPSHGMSVNNGQYRWNNAFEMILGPSIRRISDLSDMSRSKSILPTGQSGNPLSDHYGDQTNMWLDGQYRWLYQDSTLFEEADIRTMRLVPVE
ncbi:MAG: penicillin acylase family protein [Gracilimonas sp.]|uniref:penicillin acylase family protein n=1 Tax=Gracilimonas sp. TaxID=1974203 RepID=UPI001B2EA7B3|nr:penicillin acylase family protein [Gracilimonas sp.]MBO6586793.1 penicillin acylase family protein [Gracilimonas sp.]MBO6615450.1 penicillin acylase family protein [Gracilimonas sp.]